MPSIGNDIVDLQLTGNRGKSKDRAFIRRVFTSDEEAAIRGARDSDYALWSLWAAKEAVYKAAMKQNPVPFIPRRFCFIFDGSSGFGGRGFRGWMNTPVGVFRVSVEGNENFVHSVALSPDLSEERVTCRFWPLEEGDESAGLRKNIRAFLSPIFDCREDELEVRRLRRERGFGPPVLYLRGRPLDIDISLSHDGRWGAFASFLDRS